MSRIACAQLPVLLADGGSIRGFANRWGGGVWGALEHWGPAVVRGWMWCGWNEPNNTWIGGGVSFEQYRAIYESVAEQVVHWLAPHLGGGSPRLGGPSVEGFHPFWLDWIWRFVEEIDHSLIGFSHCHFYPDQP